MIKSAKNFTKILFTFLIALYLISTFTYGAMAVREANSFRTDQDEEFLASAAEVILANELLSGNIHMAKEKLRELLATRSDDQVCLKILKTKDRSEVSSFGSILNCSEIQNHTSRIIYFDRAREIPAFQVLVKVQPSFDFTKISFLAWMVFFAPLMIILMTMIYFQKRIGGFMAHLESLLKGSISPKNMHDQAAQDFVELSSLAAIIDANRNTQKLEAIASTTQMLAHDIRKPFSMFKMLVDNVQNAKSTQEASSILTETLPEVNQSLASVEGLIQDVMQIGADTTAALEDVSPESIIESSMGDLFRVYPAAAVTLKYSLNHTHCVQADTLKIGRVFANILGNALQAMSNKGELWIETQEKDGRIEFVLGNSGSVIPEKSLEKLFEAFYTSGKKGGTGLGLAIAKKAIELHGGKIHCRSAVSELYPSGFVEFVFSLAASNQIVVKSISSLPVTSSEVQATFKRLLASTPATETASELESDLERKVIGALAKLDAKPVLLVVDDEAVYRNALVSLVSRSPELSHKIDVVTASNSDQALKLCQSNNPVLILQDIDLGSSSLDGLEVIAELRKREFKGHICVHSNRFLPDDNKNAMVAGANFVIPKPMSRAHLLKTLLSSMPQPVMSEQQNSAPLILPKIVYIDDSATFLFGFKRTVEGKAEVQTFKTSTLLLKKIADAPTFFDNLSLIVTDFYFDPTDPMNGLNLAVKLRELGYQGPLVLASDVELDALDAKDLFVGKISKSSFDWHEIKRFLPHT